MSRRNHMLFMSIQCDMSLLSRCIVGQPTRVNLTSLPRGNHFHRSIKGAYKCFSFTTAITSLRKKKIYISLPSVLFCHLLGDLLCGYEISFAIGRISSPTIAENNKLSSIIAVNLNASFFDSQLHCHTD